MGRRVSSGVVGGAGLGLLNVVSSTISNTVTDGDITLDPNGVGVVQLEGDAQLKAQADLRFADADSSNYVAFQAPADISSNVTWTLPNADAVVSGYALVSNSAGILSWAAAGAALSDNTSDSNSNYLTFTTSTSGFLTASRVSSTKLTFQPSTGLLTTEGTLRSLMEEVVYNANTTLALTDRSKIVTMNSGSATQITIPSDASTNFTIGSEIHLYREGAGTVELVAAGGVTLVRDGGLTGNAYMQRYEQVTLRKRSANNWVAYSFSAGALATTGGNTRTTVVNDETAAFTSGSSNFVVTAP